MSCLLGRTAWRRHRIELVLCCGVWCGVCGVWCGCPMMPGQSMTIASTGTAEETENRVGVVRG